jgi:hypothetical protein
MATPKMKIAREPTKSVRARRIYNSATGIEEPFRTQQRDIPSDQFGGLRRQRQKSMTML